MRTGSGIWSGLESSSHWAASCLVFHHGSPLASSVTIHSWNAIHSSADIGILLPDLSEAVTSQTIPQFWPPDSLDNRSELILFFCSADSTMTLTKRCQVDNTTQKTLWCECHDRVRLCSVNVTTESDSAVWMTKQSPYLQCECYNRVRLFSVNDKAESISAVWMLQQSQTLQCEWQSRVHICSVNVTTESDSLVWMTKQSPYLQCECHNRVHICSVNVTTEFISAVWMTKQSPYLQCECLKRELSPSADRGWSRGKGTHYWWIRACSITRFIAHQGLGFY